MKQSQFSKMRIISSIFYNYGKTAVPHNIMIYDDKGKSFIINNSRWDEIELGLVGEAFFLKITEEVKSNISGKKTPKKIRKLIKNKLDIKKNIIPNKHLQRMFIYVIKHD